MSNFKTKVMDRFLSVLLALVMVIGMLPITVFASATDYEGQYVITVKEKSGSALDEVEIDYKIKVDSGEKTSAKVTTDTDGSIGINLTEYTEQIAASKVTIEYTAAKSGYVSVSDVITVENATGHKKIEMRKEAEPTEQVTVIVNIAGSENGTVKLNGVEQKSVTVAKNEDVTVELTPNRNCYIKSLTVGGEVKPVEKGQAYTDIVQPAGATEITVAFAEEVTVSASANEGGQVLLNGGEDKSVTIDKNASVSLKVTPDSGYQISSVTIDGKPEKVADLYGFEKNITVAADVIINVAFVKEWVVTVTYNEESGKIETVSENTAGSVTGKAGTSVSITATPNDNYRVSKVTVNGEDTVFDDNTYSHIGDIIKPYKKELTADKNYTIKIVFAPTCFNVIYTSDKNGAVVVKNAKVDYGEGTTAEITAEGDYNIEKVYVNSSEVPFIRTDNRTVEITIGNITEDKTVTVEYTPMEETGEVPTDVAAFKGSAIRTDEESGLYVYKKGAAVTFKTDKEGIAINGITDDGNQYKTNSVTVSETIVITSIYLYYENVWHKVTPEKPIKIAIDNEEVTAPQLTPDNPHANDYYNKDFNVAVVARDAGDYSGIEKVEYWITSNGKETVARTPLYTYQKGGEILSRWTGNISVDTAKNNSDSVVVYVQVTDRAGNTSEEITGEAKVNITAPVIKVDMRSDPQPHKEAMDGYYTSARTAVVTIVDRPTTFNETAATDAIVIEANGQPVKGKAGMIQWANSGDRHQATITFSAGAKYTWHIEKYTNGAGLQNGDIVDTGNHVYEFTVDGVAPSAKIKTDGSTWEKLVSVLTFGLWKSSAVTATVKNVNDDTSEVKTALYYKSDKTAALTVSELDRLFEDDAFVEEAYTVSSDEVFTIYARITDYAGNTLYVGTNGVIYDKSKSEIKFDIDKPNGHGVYVDDVNVKVSVDDALAAERAGSVSSGIKKIDYKVEARFPGSEDLVTTQSGNLYTFDVETAEKHSTCDELKFKWDNHSAPIVVSKDKNNSGYIIVTITVEDNAGNKYSKSLDSLNISTDKPTADISFENEKFKDTRKQDDHFTARTAVIRVTDRNDVFDGTAAKAGIKLKATDSKGADIEIQEGRDYTISEWADQTVDDSDTHTAKVEFLTDGNYTIGFSYLNKTNDESKRVTVKDETFTKDATDPAGSVTVAANTWDKLLEVLTFGLYSKASVDVSATADDKTSRVVTEYYKDNGDAVLTADELAAKEFKTFEPFSVDSDEKFTVYLRITDYAGNFIYVSSNGYIVDTTGSAIVKPVQEDFNGVYNKDVEIPIEITDAEPYSGIKRIDYRVIKDGNEAEPTQQGNLFTFSEESPSHEKLRNEWTGSVTVEAEKNNSNNVVVILEVEDNAGNITTKSIHLKIDITAPVIALSYPDDDMDNNGNTYFDHTRTATVVITKRTNQFNAEKATAGIAVTAIDARGTPINDAYEVSGWSTVEGATPDEAKHTATIEFLKDANYILAISYTDEAGNPNTEITDVKGVAPWDFTVDTTPPTGTVKATSAEGREAEWDELLSSLTYGFWSNEKITITGTQDDATSAPIASVEYYKVTLRNANDNAESLTKDALDAVTSWAPFEKVEVGANEQFVLYLKITDLAGNYAYICTDGLIVDDQAPIEETVAPEITIEPQQPINGLYNTDIDVAVKVTDPLVGGTYSGLKTVSYRVLNMGKETQTGSLYTFSEKNPAQSDLLQNWSGSFTVDRTLNNSNDVKIEIITEDNSGNTSRKDVSIKIDITAPEIDVCYDNNAADSNSFFKADRTATIVVAERNFDPKDIKVTITDTDGVIPSLSEWKQTSVGTGNQDDATWAATVTYAADGDYTFDITYTDLATNLMSGVNYGDSVAPTEFTIDKTIPTISVNYDNNEAANGKYFKSPRTATVTINEHNFDVTRVTFTRTATLDGTTITLPNVSWANSGDVHTATIPYTADGDYTFDVTMSDLAGNESAIANYGNSAAAKDFTVDRTILKPAITGVEDGHAYKHEVIPNISLSDVNYDSYEVKLTRTRKDEIGVDVTGQFLDTIDVDAKGGSKAFDTFKREVGNDGIYTLTVRMRDKAGNEDTQSLTFTVNRFGSVYEYGSYLISLIQDGGAYVGTITDDLIITEYNANRLVNDSLNIEITLDGRSIDARYVADPVPNANVNVGQSGWYQYRYTISKENFNADGMYSITLSSEDEAANTPESNPNNSTDENGNAIVDTMQFRVDGTAPEITSIVGLENRIINEQTVDVRYSVYDAIGLKSITVYLDGKAQESITEFEDINNYSGTFALNESSSEQKVRILAVDKAGNTTDTDDFGKTDANGNVIIPMPAYSFNNTVTVSTNFFVRWYANKPLFWGSIGGVVGLAAIIWILIILLKKRKKTDETK